MNEEEYRKYLGTLQRHIRSARRYPDDVSAVLFLLNGYRTLLNCMRNLPHINEAVRQTDIAITRIKLRQKQDRVRQKAMALTRLKHRMRTKDWPVSVPPVFV